MRTLTPLPFTVYSAPELKEKFPGAFEKAHGRHCENLEFVWWDEFSNSLEKGAEHFNAKAGRYEFDADSIGRCDAGLKYNNARDVCAALLNFDAEKDAEITGYCADGEWVDAAVEAKAELKKYADMDGLDDWIISGEDTMPDGEDMDEEVLKRHNAAVKSVADSFMESAGHNFAKAYMAEWDYMRSEESFLEECEANEREFNEEGEVQ